jgi:hydroxypyruvate isomerase
MTHPMSHPLRFAANLSWLYTDLPFLDRFAAAARDGFTAVECLFPHEHPTADIAARLRDTGLQMVLFNAAPGDWAAGERGLAGLADREADFQRSIHEALARADAFDCPRIHVMAGKGPSVHADPVRHEAALATYESRLRWAVAQAEAAGRLLTIEPLNPRDMPDYLLRTQAQAHEIVGRIGSAALKVQLDLYHLQVTEGDVSMALRRWLHGDRDGQGGGQVGHIQIAAVPDRCEPDDGELNADWLWAELRRLGWTGWIGCEYRPRRAPDPVRPGWATTAGLGWLARAQAPDDGGHALSSAMSAHRA